jgi:hypothetical protein
MNHFPGFSIRLPRRPSQVTIPVLLDGDCAEFARRQRGRTLLIVAHEMSGNMLLNHEMSGGTSLGRHADPAEPRVWSYAENVQCLLINCTDRPVSRQQIHALLLSTQQLNFSATVRE